MKIEDEIHQQIFADIDQKTIVNIIYTSNWAIDRMAPVLEEFDITMQQFNVLRILRGQYPNHGNIALIKERILDKQPDVPRLLERLIKKEWVSRKLDSTDRRKVKFTITESGLQLLSQIDPLMKKFSALFSSLSVEEKEKLNRLLDKLRG